MLLQFLEWVFSVVRGGKGRTPREAGMNGGQGKAGMREGSRDEQGNRKWDGRESWGSLLFSQRVYVVPV